MPTSREQSDYETRRFDSIDDEVKDLRKAVYGSENSLGLLTRLKVLEARLQIFWWCLAVVGSTAIGLGVQVLFGHLNGVKP